MGVTPTRVSTLEDILDVSANVNPQYCTDNKKCVKIANIKYEGNLEKDLYGITPARFLRCLGYHLSDSWLGRLQFNGKTNEDVIEGSYKLKYKRTNGEDGERIWKVEVNRSNKEYTVEYKTSNYLNVKAYFPKKPAIAKDLNKFRRGIKAATRWKRFKNYLTRVKNYFTESC